VSLVVSAAPGADAFGAGVGLPAGATPSSGLFAVVERTGAAQRIAVYRRSGGGAPAEVAAEPLPAPADPAAPITLEVTAYDDELQARVGETRVRVAREGQRAGRCCLVATGPASFASLAVHGLDVFGFPVTVSRFRSFEAHVHSFDGAVGTAAPNVLGAGSTTTTVAALFAATQTQIAAVMTPEADGGARQALFDRWVAGLGLPLRTDLAGLSITVVRDAGGAVAALLLESPEPLDFVAEVTPALTRRVGVWTPNPLPGDLVDTGLLGRLHALDGAVVDVAVPEPPPPPPLTVTAVGEHPEGLRLDLATAGAALRPGQVVSVARTGGAGELPRFFSGTLARADAATATLVASEVSPLETGAVHAELGGLLTTGVGDTIAIGIGGHVPLFGHWSYHDEPESATVLQDRDGLRALLIPTTAGSATSLPAGDHHLMFRLDRVRYETTAPADAVNHYAAAAGVDFKI
jgi:hypothetical protein